MLSDEAVSVRQIGRKKRRELARTLIATMWAIITMAANAKSLRNYAHFVGVHRVEYLRNRPAASATANSGISAPTHGQFFDYGRSTGSTHMVRVVPDDWDRPCFASNESTANSGNGRGRDCRAWLTRDQFHA